MIANIRRLAKLEVVVLEQRATPAVLEGFALPVTPSEAVQVAPLVAHSSEAAVRTDLFGVGESSEAADPDWQAWCTGETASEEECLSTASPASQQPVDDADGDATVEMNEATPIER